MGLSADSTMSDDPSTTSSEDREIETDRMTEHSSVVLRSLSFDDSFSSSHFSMPCWSSDTLELLDRAMVENFKCRIMNMDDGTKFIVDEHGHDDILGESI